MTDIRAHERRLAVALLAEIVVFALLGDRFLTLENGFEIVRLSVELGLLAVAMTLVIVTGGIDLSVGSMMGLAAVTFGWLTAARGWPWPVAVLVTLLVGAGCGAVNGLLIARLRIPALIVTLGTFSLFRGLAEGATGAILNFTTFTPRFLWWGQGYLAGGIPAQLPVFVAVVAAFWVLLQRSTFGRSLYAIGHSEVAARYAGLPTARHLSWVYVLCSLTASLAAMLYVARVGQAKADAGTEYELLAICAVVLGGTSIFGGSGTIRGTLLGLFAVAVLENGLRMAGLPAELKGVLVGGLLIGAIAAPKLGALLRAESGPVGEEEFEMKNIHVAVLSVAMLLGAMMIAASNYAVAGRLDKVVDTWAVHPSAPAAAPAATPETPPAKKLVVALMPKSKGDPYFVSCRQGAEEAARELGVELLWDGPTETDEAKQNEVAEAWITKGVDVIAVSVQSPVAISTVLRKAKARGIGVLTWDADAQPDARDYFINQATPEGIGYTLVDEANRVLGGQGKFAIITSTLTAANQNEWIKHIRTRLETYPGLELVTIEPGEDQLDKAMQKTQNVLKAYPDVTLIMAISAPAVPGAAEAVKQSGRQDVKVIGLSLPNMCKPYLKAGIVDCIVLWNTGDLGYLTVQAAAALKSGKLTPETTSFEAGRLGALEVKDGEVLLGQPFVFNAENVDQFDF